MVFHISLSLIFVNIISVDYFLQRNMSKAKLLKNTYKIQRVNVYKIYNSDKYFIK